MRNCRSTKLWNLWKSGYFHGFPMVFFWKMALRYWWKNLKESYRNGHHNCCPSHMRRCPMKAAKRHLDAFQVAASLPSSSSEPAPECHRFSMSIDWFKGKFTGRSHISWENPWFPVDFPFSQPIDYGEFGGQKWGCLHRYVHTVCVGICRDFLEYLRRGATKAGKVTVTWGNWL